MLISTRNLTQWNSFDRLTWLTMLWTCSIRVFGVVDVIYLQSKIWSYKSLYFIIMCGCKRWTLNSGLESFSMSLVLSAFAGSWGITVMILYQTSEYLMKLDQCPLSASSVNTSFGCKDTCHASWKLMLLVGLSPYKDEWRRSRGRPGSSWLW